MNNKNFGKVAPPNLGPSMACIALLFIIGSAYCLVDMVEPKKIAKPSHYDCRSCPLLVKAMQEHRLMAHDSIN